MCLKQIWCSRWVRANQNIGRVTNTGRVCEGRLASLTPERQHWSGWIIQNHITLSVHVGTCIPERKAKTKYPSIHFLPQLPSCWSLFQVEHKTNLKKFFNATMILSLFQALGTICIYPQVEVKEASSTLVSLKYWTETYLSLLLLATDNAGALPWHVSHLASGKRRPLRSLSTERDKRYRSHITYQFIVFQHFVYLIAISYPPPLFFLT